MAALLMIEGTRKAGGRGLVVRGDRPDGSGWTGRGGSAVADAAGDGVRGHVQVAGAGEADVAGDTVGADMPGGAAGGLHRDVAGGRAQGGPAAVIQVHLDVTGDRLCTDLAG